MFTSRDSGVISLATWELYADGAIAIGRFFPSIQVSSRTWELYFKGVMAGEGLLCPLPIGDVRRRSGGGLIVSPASWYVPLSNLILGSFFGLPVISHTSTFFFFKCKFYLFFKCPTWA